MATLARIVTGDTEVNTQSLQNAFAEANANLRQSNTLIGEYSIVDDDGDEGPLPALEAIEQQTVLSTLASSAQALPKEPLPTLVSNGQCTNGQPGNGHTIQPTLFSGSQAKPNGAALAAPLNDNGKSNNNGIPHQQEEVMPPGKGRLPVPRPRLLI